jgi:cyclase
MAIRRAVTSALVAAAALSALPRTASAQQAAAAPVNVTTTKFGNNFYAIDGRGGRAGALVGPDGVFMVDAQFPDVTDRIVAAIKQVSSAPIKLLVNTHVHGDHTGGNANFAKLGVTLMSRPLLRQRLANPPAPANGGAAPAVDPASLPTVTYDDRTVIHMNGERIHLIPLRGAHTDGDTGVYFEVADVLMTGDVFRSLGHSYFDLGNGGTLTGMIAALDLLAYTAGPNTTVVPGHGDITNRAGILAHRDILLAIRDKVQTMKRQGMTVDQVVAAKPTAEWDERVGNAAQSADRLVRNLYAELR